MQTQRQMVEGGELSFERTSDEVLIVHLSGARRLRHGMPSASEFERAFAAPFDAYAACEAAVRKSC